MVANLALGAADDDHVGDLLDQVGGGGDEGQVWASLLLCQAR